MSSCSNNRRTAVIGQTVALTTLILGSQMVYTKPATATGADELEVSKSRNPFD